MYITVIILFIYLTLGNGVEYHLSPPDKIFIKVTYDNYSIRGVKYNEEPEIKIPLLSIYHMIDKLQPCTKYNFVFTLEKKGFSLDNIVNVTKSITTGIGVNLPIKIVNMTSNSTTISVISQISQIDCVDYLEMTTNGNTITYTNHNILEQITVGPMESCKEYNLIICLVINDHRYLAYHGTITTEPDEKVKISTVSNIKTIPKNNITSITWSPPSGLRTQCVKTYFVELFKDRIFINSTFAFSTRVDFIDLEPCVAYDVRIQSYSGLIQSISPQSNYRFETGPMINTPTCKHYADQQLDAAFNFRISNNTSQSIQVSWNNIQPMSTQEKILKITKQNYNYELKKNCTFTKYERNIEIQQYVFQQKIEYLEPATNYSLEIKISNMTGEKLEYTKTIYGSTKPGVPPKVLNAQVTGMNVIGPSVTIQWDLPCQLNGTIYQIYAEFYGSGINSSMSSTYHNSTVDPKQNSVHTRVKPDYRYNVTITTLRKLNIIVYSEAVTVQFVSPPECPDIYSLAHWGTIQTDLEAKTHITIKITPKLQGLINLASNISVVIANLDDCEALQPTYKLHGHDHKIYQPQDMMPNQKCPTEYRAYAKWNRLTVGDCINKKNCLRLRLKSDSDYQILLRVYTPRGFADTNPINFATKVDTSNILLTILIILFICLIVRISFRVRYLYKSQNVDQPVEIKPTDESTTRSENEILDEYTSIQQMSLGEIKKSVGIKYAAKNRYIDIIPYDFNRVVLPTNQFCTTDYINASYINGFNHNHKFIATQGPTNYTAYDFWHMVIEMKCHKIVMVTKLIENGLNKCFHYYPDLNEAIQFNDIFITNADELNLRAFIRRELIVRRGPTKHLVIQYEFTEWPDHGCPENEMDLINFIEFINNDDQSSEPIVVHCSAGVGRTGTFIALDILIDKINHKTATQICNTVKQLRMQRATTVYTVEQYKFLHQCVAKYINQKCLQDELK